MTDKRFVQLKDKGFEHSFIDMTNLDISYICDNKNDCKNIVDLLNELNDENGELKSENEKYKNMFFELVETALTDKNCRELYCKGILDIFDNANSLNQAREMIKGRLK